MKRPIRVEGDVAYVPLTKGYEAVIDAADAPIATGHNWCALESRRRDGSVRAVYAVRGSSGRLVYLHRVLLGPGHEHTDHIDCDGLNNRRSNLRPATAAENQRNMRLRSDSSSGEKGVSWCKREQRWRAFLSSSGQFLSLGYFSTRDAARDAVRTRRVEVHGNFARHA